MWAGASPLTMALKASNAVRAGVNSIEPEA
jgi:hypothetical protein